MHAHSSCRFEVRTAGQADAQSAGDDGSNAGVGAAAEAVQLVSGDDRDHDLSFGECVDLFDDLDDLGDLFDLVALAFFLARCLESALAVHLFGFNQVSHSIENGVYFFALLFVVCEHLPQFLRRSVPL